MTRPSEQRELETTVTRRIRSPRARRTVRRGLRRVGCLTWRGVWTDGPLMTALDHEHYMRRAIALTANCPRLPFGALIVRADTGEVVAEGWNKSAINPTWHGEIDAINRLAEAGRADGGSELVLYTPAEPCPMCMAATCGAASARWCSAHRSASCSSRAGGRSTSLQRTWCAGARVGLHDHRRRPRTGVPRLVRGPAADLRIALGAPERRTCAATRAAGAGRPARACRTARAAASTCVLATGPLTSALPVQVSPSMAPVRGR